MIVTLLISSMTFFSSVSSLENCLLSTKTSNLSFVVTVRKRINPDINDIICIGLLIDWDEMVIPSKCLSQTAVDEFYTGKELKAVTGIESGSCRQVRFGVNYKSLILLGKNARIMDPNLLRYVATLQVHPFRIEKGYEPYKALKKLLPDNETNLKRYVEEITGHNITCSVPLFVQDSGKSNNVIQAKVLPIKRKECESILCPAGIRAGEGDLPSCPGLLWSPETYSCLAFVNQEYDCKEYNMGSPIICEDKVCGMLKKCYPGILVMQLLTVEHLTTLEHDVIIHKNGTLKCFIDLVLTWTCGVLTILTTFASLGHRWK